MYKKTIRLTKAQKQSASWKGNTRRTVEDSKEHTRPHHINIQVLLQQQVEIAPQWYGKYVETKSVATRQTYQLHPAWKLDETSGGKRQALHEGL